MASRPTWAAAPPFVVLRLLAVPKIHDGLCRSIAVRHMWGRGRCSKNSISHEHHSSISFHQAWATSAPRFMLPCVAGHSRAACGGSRRVGGAARSRCQGWAAASPRSNFLSPNGHQPQERTRGSLSGISRGLPAQWGRRVMRSANDSEQKICAHKDVTRSNQSELPWRFICSQCGALLTCSCDTAWLRRVTPSVLTRPVLDQVSGRMVKPTLGEKVCHTCRGPQAPDLPAAYGRSAFSRRNWRAIFNRHIKVLQERATELNDLRSRAEAAEARLRDLVWPDLELARFKGVLRHGVAGKPLAEVPPRSRASIERATWRSVSVLGECWGISSTKVLYLSRWICSDSHGSVETLRASPSSCAISMVPQGVMAQVLVPLPPVHHTGYRRGPQW